MEKAIITEEERMLLAHFRTLDYEGRLVVMGAAIEEHKRTERELERQRRIAAAVDFQREILHVIE